MHRSAALGFALLCACSFPGPPTLLPPPFGPDPAKPEAARLFFPSGLAIDPTATWVIVANSNADRQYDFGAMYTLRASVLQGYFTNGPGTIAFGEDPTLLAGTAMMGNFAGPLVLAGGKPADPVNNTPAIPLTAYTASRDTNLLNSIALDPSTGALSCRTGIGTVAGNEDCHAGSIDLERTASVEGPFAIVAASIQPPPTPAFPFAGPVDSILVTSLVPGIDDTQSGVLLTSAHLAALPQFDPSQLLYTATVTNRLVGAGVGSGSMVFDDRARELILAGCYVRFGSASAGGEPSTLKCGTLGNTSSVRFIPVDAGSTAVARIYDLSSQLHAQDMPGLALGDVDPVTGLRTLYSTLRTPDGIAKIGISSDPAFAPIVLSVLTTSSQPSQLLRLIRPPGNTGHDLLAVTAVATFETSTTAGKLLVYDAVLNRIVAQVEGLGDTPYAIAQFPPAPTDMSAKLVVTMFGSCRLSLIEVPFDNPGNASLRANVGSCPP
jgi:hypothetical protein